MLDKTSDQASNLEQESYFSNANVEGVTWSEAIKEASKPDSKQARKQASKQVVLQRLVQGFDCLGISLAKRWKNLEPRWSILRLWAPKAAFTKACSGI